MCDPARRPQAESHTLIALAHSAVTAAKVTYLTAPDLVKTLNRGLADNTVGKTIKALLRNDVVPVDDFGFAPFRDPGAQLLFRLVAAGYEGRSLGIASEGGDFPLATSGDHDLAIDSWRH